MIAAIGSRMGSPSTDRLVQRRGSACPFTLPQPDRRQCCLIRKNSCWFFFLRPFLASICSAASLVDAAIIWLILLSLVFYGWWRPVNILIIGPSIIINYTLGVDPAAAEPGGRVACPVKGGSIAGNRVQRVFSRFFQIYRLSLRLDQ